MAIWKRYAILGFCKISNAFTFLHMNAFLVMSCSLMFEVADAMLSYLFHMSGQMGPGRMDVEPLRLPMLC